MGLRPPPPLFKYTKREYAEALIQRGALRLGTLDCYRKVEYHAPMIGDAKEGDKGRYDNPALTTTAGLSPIAARIAHGAIGGLPSGAVFDRCLFEEVEQFPNCWLYCTSARLSAKLMHSMDPEYDACVRIDYAGLFSRIVATELLRQNLIASYSQSGIGPCVYRERSRPYQDDDGLPPVFLKDPSYAGQEEVRFVFLPREPITVDHLDLTRPLRGAAVWWRTFPTSGRERAATQEA